MSEDDSRYLERYDFISFSLELRECAPAFWMTLGEIRSKCSHVRFTPITEELLRRLHQIYLVRGVNATTAIEGNTLDEDEVLERLEGRLELPPSKEYLGREVDNIIGVYNAIQDQVLGDGGLGEITPERLQEWNRMILADLEVDAHVEPGSYRRVSVTAGPYVAPPWQSVDHLVDRLCKWLNSSDFEPPHEDLRVAYAFVRAVVAHVYIEWIHAFGDGNGRLGRAVEFALLLDAGVPMVSSHVLQSHYNDTRSEYYRQLNTSTRNGGDLRDFLAYAAIGFRDGLNEQLSRLHSEAEQLMWRALVDERLAAYSGKSADRQRLLAIELGKREEGVRRAELMSLNPDLTERYMDHTRKMRSRDLGRLQDVGLVTMSGDLIRPSLWLVRALRPPTADEATVMDPYTP